MSTLPDALPLLAVGSHGRGTGKACIMNAISYLNGDTQITDMPACSDDLLSAIAQHVNDGICLERKQGDDPLPLLCSTCSARMWRIGVHLIGSSEFSPDPLNRDSWVGLLRVGLAALRQRMSAGYPGSFPRLFQEALHALQVYAYSGVLIDAPRLVEGHTFNLDKPRNRPPSEARNWVIAMEVYRQIHANRIFKGEGVGFKHGELGVRSGLEAGFRLISTIDDPGQFALWQNAARQDPPVARGAMHEPVHQMLTTAINTVDGRAKAELFEAAIAVWEAQFRPGFRPATFSQEAMDEVANEIRGVPA